MNPDISGYGNFSPSDSSLQNVGASSSTSSTKSGGTKDSSSLSTIQKSELEALVYMLVANMPMLPRPNEDFHTSSSSSVTPISTIAADAATRAETYYQMIVKETSEKKHEIVKAMWDSFLKAIHEFGERVKEEELKKWRERGDNGGPMSATEYYAYLITLTASEKTKLEDGSTSNALAEQFKQAFNNWIVIPSKAESDSVAIQASNGYPSMAFIAGTLATNFFRDAIGTGSEHTLSINPVADALQVGGPVSGLPGDSQAAAAMIAALLYNGAVNKAMADTVLGAATGGKPPQTLDFAMNFAQIIKSIITHSVKEAADISPERAKADNLVRLTLACIALNLLYRAGYGGMSGQELRDLIKGDTTNVDPKIKPLIEELIALINRYLPTAPVAREKAMANLENYVNSKHSVEAMLKETNLLSNLIGVNDADRKRLEELEG